MACVKLEYPAQSGDYVLSVDCSGNVAVSGSHSANGVVVATWNHTDLQSDYDFFAAPGENHQIFVIAVFTEPVDDSEVIVECTPGMEKRCVLTPEGEDVADISLGIEP